MKSRSKFAKFLNISFYTFTVGSLRKEESKKKMDQELLHDIMEKACNY
ncbi:MAG: hypothetical protein GWN31_08780 [Candidatus Thorarchaeota archaeon]|nr:hypothetical protein [Candidatus Thorarchaeota archaeon]